MKLIKDLTQNDVVHCTTQEEADTIVRLINESGILKSDSDANRHWNGSNGGLCFRISNGYSYNGGYNYYSKEGCFTIYEAKHIIEFNQPQKSKVRILKRADYARMLNAACNYWEDKLSCKFAKQFSIFDEVELDESFYNEIIDACDSQQLKLMNEIFPIEYTIGDKVITNGYCEKHDGKVLTIRDISYSNDGFFCYFEEGAGEFSINKIERFATGKEIEKVNQYVFKAGDWVFFDYGKTLKERSIFTSSTWNKNFTLQISFINEYGDPVFCKEEMNRAGCKSVYSNCSNSFKVFRFATDEEIEATKHYPEGTPCLVREFDTVWKLYYADGKGKFYGHGKRKSGLSISWYNHMMLDVNNLPE